MHAAYERDAETYGPNQYLHKFNDKQDMVSIKRQLSGPGKGENLITVSNIVKSENRLFGGKIQSLDYSIILL